MTETAEITAADGKAGSYLGRSVQISGSSLLAGAPNAHSGQGVVYLFSEPSGGWQTSAGGIGIAASDGVPYDDFGSAVGIGGDVLAVSETGWPNGGIDQDGAVYVFGPAQ